MTEPVLSFGASIPGSASHRSLKALAFLSSPQAPGSVLDSVRIFSQLSGGFWWQVRDSGPRVKYGIHIVAGHCATPFSCPAVSTVPASVRCAAVHRWPSAYGAWGRRGGTGKFFDAEPVHLKHNQDLTLALRQPRHEFVERRQVICL